jgi:thiol-disulfide isomerase/thioredoxin
MTHCDKLGKAITTVVLTCSVSTCLVYLVGCSTAMTAADEGAPADSARPVAEVSATAAEFEGLDTSSRAIKLASSAPKATIDPPRRYPLPEGGAEQLLMFVRELDDRNLSGDTRDTRLEDYFEMLSSQYAAANGILATESEAGLLDQAHIAKLRAMYTMISLGRLGLTQEVATYAQTITDTTPNAHELAQRVLAELPSAVAKSRFESTFNDVVADVPGADARLQSELTTIADALGPSRMVYQLADTSITVLEQIGKYDQVGPVFSLLQRTFPESVNAEVAKHLQSTRANFEKRIGMIGKPITLTGKTLDGKDVQSIDTRNKVVLVDFWATTCGPCVAEMPNLKALYDEYHDEGFEIIGISVDENRDDVKQFVKSNLLTWPIVFDLDSSVEGPDPPNSVQYGIETLPTTVLVGKDGVVSKLHVRGDRLKEELLKALQDSPRPAGPAL